MMVEAPLNTQNNRDAPLSSPNARAGAALGMALALACASCAYKPSIPPSEGHLDRETVPAPKPGEQIMPPVTSNAYVPPPKPRVKTPTYSVVVHEVPVKELLLALARYTGRRINAMLQLRAADLLLSDAAVRRASRPPASILGSPNTCLTARFAGGRKSISRGTRTLRR